MKYIRIFMLITLFLLLLNCKKENTNDYISNKEPKYIKVNDRLPDFNVNEKNIMYDLSSDKHIDFNNFEYYIDNVNTKYVVSDGKYLKKYKDFGEEEFTVASINECNGYYIINLKLLLIGGSSSSCGYVQIFKIFDNKLLLFIEIKYDDEGESDFSVNRSENTFNIKTYNYDKEDPNCCPSLLSIGKYKIQENDKIELLESEVFKKRIF